MAARTYRDTTNTITEVPNTATIVVQTDDGFAGMAQTTVANLHAKLVEKVEGKGLSSNDYDAAAVATVARVNTLDNANNLENAINVIKVDGTVVTPVNKEVDIDLSAAMEGNIVDNLTTDDATKALSAKQGKILNEGKADVAGEYPDLHAGLADQLYSPDSDTSDAEYYVFRTSGGSADLSDGEAQLRTIRGYADADATTHALSGIATPTSFKSVGTNQFKPENVLAGVGINPATGAIVTKAGYSVAYIHAKGNVTSSAEGDALVGYTVWCEYGGIDVVGFSETIPTVGGMVKINGMEDATGHVLYVGRDNYTSGGDWSIYGTDQLTNVQNIVDGFICVTIETSKLAGLCVHPRWSGYKNNLFEEYNESIIAMPTQAADGTNLPTATYGFPSLGNVCDEIDFITKQYIQRIGYKEYSAANLNAVVEMGVAYAYATNIGIIYVLPAPITHTLRADAKNTYTVADFGTEEFLGTVLPVESINLYLQNLRDKLRRDVVTYEDVVDNLISTSKSAPLSANMGRVLAESKADVDGYYAGMHVGLADNLFSSDNISSFGTYAFRTAGGDVSLQSGVANVTSVQGNANVPVYSIPKANCSVTAAESTITATVDAETFATQVSESGTVNFKYNGTTWTRSGSPVALANYGIEVNGTPINGDEINVTFTKGVAEATVIYPEVGSPLVISVNKATYETRGRLEVEGIPSTKSFMFKNDAWKVAAQVGGVWTQLAIDDTPADWGITISGEPIEGNIFTVNYVANSASASTAKVKFVATIDLDKFEDVKVANVYLPTNNYKFVLQANDTWTFFKKDGENWTSIQTGITTAVLADTYGIEISAGVPIANDEILVNFTAASITGEIALGKADYFEASSMQWFKAADKRTGYEVDASGHPGVNAGKTIGWFRVEGGLDNGFIIRNLNANSFATAQIGWSTEKPIDDEGTIKTSAAATLFTYSDVYGADRLLENNLNKIIPSDADGVEANTTYVLFPPAEARYIWFTINSTTAATVDATFAHPRWSNDTFDLYNIVDNPWAPSRIVLRPSTIDGTLVPGWAYRWLDDNKVWHNLPWEDFGGLPAVNKVRDEINLNSMSYAANVGKIDFVGGDEDHAIRRQILALCSALQNEGIDYIFDLTSVYYARPAAQMTISAGGQTYTLEAKRTYAIPKVYQNKTTHDLVDAKTYEGIADKSNYEEYILSQYTVNDYGYEAFPISDALATPVKLVCTTLYGSSLLDKLRHDVVISGDLAEGGQYFSALQNMVTSTVKETPVAKKRLVNNTITSGAITLAPDTSTVITNAINGALAVTLTKPSDMVSEEHEWRLIFKSATTTAPTFACSGCTFLFGDQSDVFECVSGAYYEVSIVNLGIDDKLAVAVREWGAS